MLPSAPPRSRPSATDSTVFRPELPWYQTMSATTPIDTMREQVGLVAEQPEQRPGVLGMDEAGPGRR